MTDRNLDYSYADKQRVLSEEHYGSYSQPMWTPSGVVGETMDGSGAEFWRMWADGSDPTESRFEYALRDGIPVIAWKGTVAGANITLEAAGLQALGFLPDQRTTWGPDGIWEYFLLMYWNASNCDLMLDSDWYDLCHLVATVENDDISIWVESYPEYGWDDTSESDDFAYTGGNRSGDEWIAIRYRIDCDTPLVSANIWWPADPTDPTADEPAGWLGSLGSTITPMRTVMPLRMYLDQSTAADAFEIARFGWGKVKA